MKIFEPGVYKDNIVEGNPSLWESSSIIFKGHNNKVIIERGARIKNTSIIMSASDSKVLIGQSVSLRGMILIGMGCHVSIGEGTTVSSSIKMKCAEMTKLLIGSDCMFGNDVTVFTHDFHPIFEADSGRRINKSKDVIIGNHVWVGDEVRIMKGSVIGDGSVVGLRTLVTGRFDNACMIVGSPAKAIRRGIIWERHSFNTTPPFTFPDKKNQLCPSFTEAEEI